jgi:tRNA ligase
MDKPRWRRDNAVDGRGRPLMLKSNGCIIFIAVLSLLKLLITSKQSVGPIQGIPESHAQASEHWLCHHLEQVGKTMEELAVVLWEKNWTAVAEVSHPFSWLIQMFSS